MKRTGKRGEGKWEEISWEEAFDTIASEMKRIKETYGNEALWYHYGSGSTGGNITKRGTWPRLINSYGGYLGQYGELLRPRRSPAAFPHQYGAWMASNSLEDAQHTSLQVMFGNNPLETRMSGGGELGVVQKIRKDHGIRTIVVDPRYSDTAVDANGEWVPVRPGTDAAFIAGIDLRDGRRGSAGSGVPRQVLRRIRRRPPFPTRQSRIRRYRAYLEGKGPDGIEKTPEWGR